MRLRNSFKASELAHKKIHLGRVLPLGAAAPSHKVRCSFLQFPLDHFHLLIHVQLSTVCQRNKTNQCNTSSVEYLIHDQHDRYGAIDEPLVAISRAILSGGKNKVTTLLSPSSSLMPSFSKMRKAACTVLNLRYLLLSILKKKRARYVTFSGLSIAQELYSGFMT